MSITIPLVPSQMKAIENNCAKRFAVVEVFHKYASKGAYEDQVIKPTMPIIFLGKVIGQVNGDGSIVRMPSNRVALEPDLKSDCYLEQLAWSHSLSMEDSEAIESLLVDASFNVKSLDHVKFAELKALSILSKYFGG